MTKKYTKEIEGNPIKIEKVTKDIEKIMIFDASILITFAMNGLLPVFRKLKEDFAINGGKFIIPLEVKEEIIDKPLKIKRFELEALQLKKLLDESVIELPSAVGVEDKEISKVTEDISVIADTTFYSIDRERYIDIIDSGEAACVALAKILKEKGIESILAIDERTTRLLCEDPKALEKIFEKKLKTKIKTDKKKFSHFEGFKIIRSSELVYVAYKKGFVELPEPKNSNLLVALLYAVKYKGSSISHEEIKQIKKMN